MAKKMRWLGGITLAVLVMSIALLPLGLEFYAESWLENHGVESPQVGDIDLNPFSGVVRLEELSFSGDAGQEGKLQLAEADFEWTSLFGKQVLIRDVRLASGRIDIQRHVDGAITVGGLQLPPPGVADASGSAPTNEWGIGLNDLSIDDVAISYRDAKLDHRLMIEDADLDRLSSKKPTEPSVLSADLVLDDAEISVRIEGTPLAPEPEIAAELSLSGLVLQRYAAHLGDIGADDVAGDLSARLSTNLRSAVNGQYSADTEFRIELDDLAGVTDFAAVRGDALTWTGNFRATISADPGATPRVAGTSDLKLSGLDIRHRVNPIRLLALDEFSIEGAALDESGDLRFDNLVLTALELLRYDEDTTPTLQIARAMLGNVAVTTAPFVDIDVVTLDDAIIRVQRQADGSIRLVTEVVEDFRQAQSGTVTEAPVAIDADSGETRPVLFRIGTIDLGEASRVVVSDASVEPAFSSSFDLKTFRLTGIGNVEPGMPAHLVLDIEQEDAARVAGEGDFALFGDERNVDFTVSLRNLDLTQISSYVPAYHIQRGRLSTQTRAKLNGDVLDITNAVEVDKLKLAAKAAGESDTLGEGMAMPLDTALDLLRDGDDRIVIDLPISGSLQDPEFGTGDLLRLAMQNAMQKAAISYAKNALQPLGTIMFFAKVAGDASRPRFQPLAFEPGDATLSTKGRGYLEKIAGMLAERPNLSITFCGVATQGDLDLMRARLAPTDEPPSGGAPEQPAGEPASVPAEPPTFDVERMELARARGTSVQDYFVTELGIAADRLYRCRPRVDAAEGDGPRVEIML